MIQTELFWLVLAGSVLAYWLTPLALRPWTLAIASVAYIASLDLSVAVALMILVCAFYWLSGIAADKGGTYRWLVPALVLCIVSYLAYYKYLPVVVHELTANASAGTLQLVIPLGISYFTFKLIHYAVERRRGSLPAHGFGDFLAYMYLFPIYTAGPIERFDHFVRNRAEHFHHQHLLDGAYRVSYGLIKKFIIGGIILIWLRDTYASAGVESLLADLDKLHPLRVWLFVILSYLLIYMDFSAYSDIAIGSSRFFGIRIMENFNFPIVASNIGNFWKRWHMTLAGWCQSYIYMPTIGITRNPYLAVIATFIVIGIWHAASLLWLLWGLYHAVGVIAYQSWARWRRKAGRKSSQNPLTLGAARTFTFLFVSSSFAFTAVYGHGSAYDAVRILVRLVGIQLA